MKYLTIQARIYNVDDMCFGPGLASILPELPGGDWNDGLVAKDTNGQPCFARANRTSFPGVTNTWKNIFIDYSEIVLGEKLRTGVYAVECPLLKETVVAKFARFDWEIQYLENETTAYRWIDGPDIGPRFLAHLTEDGRVIGFLMERIANARHAGPQDLESCRQTLSRLHSLGVCHGDINRFNFLIQGSKCVLVDFDTACKCDRDQDRAHELDDLHRSLQDQSGRGGGGRT